MITTKLLELVPWKKRDEYSEEIIFLNSIYFSSDLPILINNSNLATLCLLFIKKKEILLKYIFNRIEEEEEAHRATKSQSDCVEEVKMSVAKIEEIIKLFGVNSEIEIVMPGYSILEDIVSNSKLMDLEMVWEDSRFMKLRLPITKYQLFDMCEILNSLFGGDKRQAWEMRSENENFYLYCDKGYFESAQLLLIENLRQSGFNFSEYGELFSSYPQVFAAICDESFNCIQNRGFIALLYWFGIEIIDLNLPTQFTDARTFCYFIRSICGDDICGTINNRRTELVNSLLSWFAPLTLHRIILPSTIRTIDLILHNPVFEIQFSNLMNALKLIYYQLFNGYSYTIISDASVIYDLYRLLKSPKMRKEDVKNLFLGINIAPEFKDVFYIESSRNTFYLDNNLLDVSLEQLILWNENNSNNNNNNKTLIIEDADYLLKFCYFVEISSKNNNEISEEYKRSNPNYTSQVILNNRNIHFGIPFAKSITEKSRIFVLPEPRQKFKKWGNFYKVVLSRRILSLSFSENIDEELITASDIVKKFETY